MEEKLAQLTAGGAPLGIFVLTAQGYENLGLNFSDIRAMVQQQQQIILAYENYYKEATRALDEAALQQQEAQENVRKEQPARDFNPFN